MNDLQGNDGADGAPIEGEGVALAVRAELPHALAKPGKVKRKVYRSQPIDPISGRRISIRSEDPGIVAGRSAEVRGARRGLASGVLTVEEAGRRMGGSLVSRMLARDCWDRYIVTLTDDWLKKAKAIWARHLAPHFGRLAAVELTKDKMVTWERWEFDAHQIAPATVENHFNLLRAALNLQVQSRNLGMLPWGNYKAPKVSSEDKLDRREACRNVGELERLVQAAYAQDLAILSRRRQYVDLAYRVLIFALLGLRQGEASGLGWDDVNLDGAAPEVCICHQAKESWRKKNPMWARPLDKPKFGKCRRMALDAAAVKTLRGQRENLRRWGLYRPDGPVFPVSRGGVGEWRSHPDAIDVERDMRPLVLAAGIPNAWKWVVHSLRHTFGTLGTDDMTALQRAMGHSDRKTTDGYIHMKTRGEARVSFYDEGAVQAPHGAPMLPAYVPEVEGEAVDAAAPRRRGRGRKALVHVAPEGTADLISFVETIDAIEVGSEARGGRKSKAQKMREIRAKGGGGRSSGGVCDFVAVWREWNAAGRPGLGSLGWKGPTKIVEAARAAYHRKYTQTVRELEASQPTVDKGLRNMRAVRAGGLAARGTYANWGKTRKRFEGDA